MPAIRSKNNLALTSTTAGPAPAMSKYFDTKHHATPVPSFPARDHEREAFRSPSGKKLTSHQWKVYDFTLTIPRGKVATYKDVAEAVGGSPRSVGNALRNNPFAPFVPCHRVIASNLFVGGYFGEWGKDHKSGTRYNQKVELLSTEGVAVDPRGYLLVKEKLLRCA
ncbi:hypothetical protein D9619_012734 [Psilocybe cf. subviscida]|uniref:Methylated-DNA--protein-cysteine methyltransferase n=1 Tax=Psilocybe cf. subviscida TaxID=2480587 RepID=A0A8H5ER41_9AGAR|nr:hypothetical protein D9619_012734 [Psilocybe cf. subviscida]